MPKKLTQEEFLAKAVAVHGVGRYDYSQTVYLPMPQKIAIRCPKHGEFMQKAAQHLFGKGCPCCGNIIRNAARGAANAKWDTATVRKRALQIHPAYNFSQFEYLGNSTKSIVICPVHGAFSSSPHYVLLGRGCPDCANFKKGLSWASRVEGKIATLYLIRVYGNNEEFYKLGITTDGVARRYKSARDMPSPYQYEILAEHKSTNAAAVWDWEQSILETFAHLKCRPKIPFPGATECFSSCDEILAIFPL